METHPEIRKKHINLESFKQDILGACILVLGLWAVEGCVTNRQQKAIKTRADLVSLCNTTAAGTNNVLERAESYDLARALGYTNSVCGRENVELVAPERSKDQASLLISYNERGNSYLIDTMPVTDEAMQAYLKSRAQN